MHFRKMHLERRPSRGAWTLDFVVDQQEDKKWTMLITMARAKYDDTWCKQFLKEFKALALQFACDPLQSIFHVQHQEQGEWIRSSPQFFSGAFVVIILRRTGTWHLFILVYPLPGFSGNLALVKTERSNLGSTSTSSSDRFATQMISNAFQFSRFFPIKTFHCLSGFSSRH